MLNKAREALGDDVVLGIDYHHRLSVAEAALLQQARPRRARFPRGADPGRDAGGLRIAAHDDRYPFAIGEEFASKWQFLPYIERGIHQFNRLDVCNVGGLTEAMKVAGWSEAHYVDLMPHNPLGPVCTAATVHLGAAVPNFAWLETRAPEVKLGFDNADFFPVQPRLDGVCYPVGDLPGLGVEVNEAAVQSESLRSGKHRTSGAAMALVTNW